MEQALRDFEGFLNYFFLIHFNVRSTAEEAQRSLETYLRTGGREFIIRPDNYRIVNLNVVDPAYWPHEEELMKRSQVKERQKKLARLWRLLNGIPLNVPRIRQGPQHDINDDSDDEYINEPEDGPGIPNYAFPIEHIRRLYTWFARREVDAIWSGGVLWRTPIRMSHIHELMSIRGIAREFRSQCIDLRFDILEVTIARDRVWMLIKNLRTREAVMSRYRRARGGCEVAYEGRPFRLIPRVKYQQLAAIDFFFLVQSSGLEIAELEFDIRPYDYYDYGQQWAATSFFWKIKKYLNRLNHRLNVRRFAMKFFEIRNHREHPTNNEGMVLSVLKFIKPEGLETIKLSVWAHPILTYTVPLTFVAQTEQWRACKHLDINDRNIRIENYDILQGFETIELVLPDEDLRPMLLSICNYEPLQNWSTKVDFQRNILNRRMLRSIEKMYEREDIDSLIHISVDTENEHPYLLHISNKVAIFLHF